MKRKADTWDFTTLGHLSPARQTALLIRRASVRGFAGTFQLHRQRPVDSPVDNPWINCVDTDRPRSAV